MCQIEALACEKPGASERPISQWTSREIAEEEEVYVNEYRDLADARVYLGRFTEEAYQARRVHSALGYLTPSEFEARW